MHALEVKDVARIQSSFLRGVFEVGSVESTDDCLWINPRFLPSEKLIKQIRKLDDQEKLVFKGDVVAVKLSGSESQSMLKDQEFDLSNINLKETEIKEAIHLEYLWDMLLLNSFEIEKDLLHTGLKSLAEQGEKVEMSVFSMENTYVGEDVTIEPNVTIIAEEGPVVLMDGATIEAGSILRGPVVVGVGATIKMASRVYGGSTIGPVCKVGGEISNCIFHSYSNKAHDGFVGNSIFGQWVNLGADTNTSNLKNNYSTVRMSDWESRKELETGMQFLGTVMADHSKTAINTMLNTGTICGISSNIFMGGFPPKYIPSFAWVGSEDYGIYKFEKAIEAMRAMMKRRDIELSDAYKAMMQHHFDER